MSVKVQGLTKLYGSQKALDNLSFDLKEGEILGLLGPNGAGKSTTMKILTCFIPQTSGQAWVCGYDVATHSLEVRRNIGYLPEHNPLEPEMYVKEYLQYVAGFYNLANPLKKISDMIDLTGLGHEQHKRIGQLSKGYRQRVGLAQAMIHDPKVLILDEPTSGLDPNQLVDIRKVITEIGKSKTVILSTHIMQEVEAICKRVLIIDRGITVADESTANLQRFKGEAVVAVEFSEKVDPTSLQRIKGVKRVWNESGFWHLSADVDTDIRKEIFDFAVQKNIQVLSMNKKEARLEDVFRELTAKKK